MAIERGEIYRVNLEPTIGVVPLSSSPRPLPPLIVPIPSTGKSSSVALCGQLRAIDRRRLFGAPMGRLSQPDLEAVERAVRRYSDYNRASFPATHMGILGRKTLTVNFVDSVLIISVGFI